MKATSENQLSRYLETYAATYNEAVWDAVRPGLNDSELNELRRSISDDIEFHADGGGRENDRDESIAEFGPEGAALRWAKTVIGCWLDEERHPLADYLPRPGVVGYNDADEFGENGVWIEGYDEVAINRHTNRECVDCLTYVRLDDLDSLDNEEFDRVASHWGRSATSDEADAAIRVEFARRNAVAPCVVTGALAKSLLSES